MILSGKKSEARDISCSLGKEFSKAMLTELASDKALPTLHKNPNSPSFSISLGPVLQLVDTTLTPTESASTITSPKPS